MERKDERVVCPFPLSRTRPPTLHTIRPLPRVKAPWCLYADEAVFVALFCFIIGLILGLAVS